MLSYIQGKLHRHIVQLQISEGIAVRKLNDSDNKLVKIEAQLLRTERKLDEKNQTIYHNRLESRAKMRHLKKTVQASIQTMQVTSNQKRFYTLHPC